MQTGSKPIMVITRDSEIVAAVVSAADDFQVLCAVTQDPAFFLHALQYVSENGLVLIGEEMATDILSSVVAFMSGWEEGELPDVVDGLALVSKSATPADVADRTAFSLRAGVVLQVPLHEESWLWLSDQIVARPGRFL